MLKILNVIFLTTFASWGVVFSQNYPADNFQLIDSTECYYVYKHIESSSDEYIFLLVEKSLLVTEIDKMLKANNGELSTVSALSFVHNKPINEVKLENKTIWTRRSRKEQLPEIIQIFFGVHTEAEGLLYDLSYLYKI